VLAGAAGLAAAAADCGVAAWGQWLAGMLSSDETALDAFLMALLPTFVAFWLMNRYRPRIPANRAALIYLLEPVFTAIISVSLGFESLTVPLLVGDLLILAGNVVEVAGWLRPRGDGA
jgi:drug/metabolite transporter (DMT)-like permease